MQELKDYTRPDEAASTPAAPQHSFDEQAVRELSFEIGKLRRWHFWAGPFLTTLVGGALMLLSEHVPSLRPGIVLVLPVLYSIFTGGLISGVVSAAIAAIAINFSYPSHTLLPSAESWPYMLWDMGGLTLVLFAGERLRRSSYRARLSDKLNRQLRYEVHERQRIEDELRLQRDNFEDTIENCAQPMHWVGPDGTILWANQAELDLLGYAQHEYVGHNIADFHADQDVIADILTRLGRDETLHSYPARLICKDKSTRQVLITSNVRHRDGEFLHTRCFTTDITSLWLQEQGLRENEDLLRRTLEALPEAVYVTDEAGVILLYNEKAAEAWGRRPVIGEDLWCGSWKIYWPDGCECPLDECPMAVALKEGREVRGQEISVERPDGTRIWVLPYPTPLRDGAGTLIGAVNMLLDITDRKDAEENYRAATAREQAMAQDLAKLTQISRLLVEAQDLPDISSDLLRIICDLTEGGTAALWTEDHDTLVCAGTYSCEPATDEFIEVTRNMVFKPGSGLPGRVLQDGTPIWVYDVATDPNFPRRPYAQRAGLESAFAFPLRSGNRVNGVIEIFYHSKLQFDERKLSSVAEAGARIGIFIDRLRAQQSMRESEQRYRALFERAGVGVVQTDLDGRIITANERYCEMIGYTVPELKGRILHDFTHPDDRGRYIYQLGLLWAGEIQRLDIEKRNIAKDGRVIWISKTLSVVRNEAGEALYTVATVQDVTPRVEAEKVLREQQDYLRAVLENSPVALAAIDQDGAYRVFCGSALEPMGITAGNRMGRTIYDAQADSPEVIEWYKRALAGEKFTVRNTVEAHTLELSFAPHIGNDGSVLGAIALATDVSDRVRDEAALRAVEARLQTTLENAPLILTEIARDGTIELIIGRGLRDAGAEPGTNVGLSVYDTNKDRPERIELFERALAGEEINYMLVDNGMAFNTFIAPRRGADGEITGVIGVLTNFTDLYDSQAKLAESEEKYRDLVETTQDVIWSLDAEGRWIFLNAAVRHVYGYEPQEMLGRYYWEFLPEELRERERAEFAKASPGHSWFQYESEHVRKDGSRVELLFTSKVIGDADGKVVRITGTASDITERKRQEQRLREREAFLSGVLDSAPFILTLIDKDGIIRLSMGGSVTHSGAPVSELVGKSVYTTYGSNPEHIRLFESALQGTSFRKPIHLGDMTYEVSARPYFDKEGSIAGVLSLALDISEHVWIESSLQDAKRELEEWQVKLDTLLGTAPIGVALVDQDCRYLYINDYLARLNGVPAEEHIGKLAHDVIPKEVADYVAGLVRQVYDTGQPVLKLHAQAESPLYPGELRDFEASMYPLVTSEGRKLGVGVLSTDVTDQRRAIDALRELKLHSELSTNESAMRSRRM